MADWSRWRGRLAFIVLGGLAPVAVAQQAFVASGMPTVGLAKDDQPPGGGTLQVFQADSGIDWSRFTVAGSAGCALPQGSVGRGDTIACGVGTVDIRDAQTGQLFYRTTFAD